MSAADTLALLAAAASSEENRQLLLWESFWYSGAADADDAKRECEHLRLSVGENEAADIRAKAADQGLTVQSSATETIISLAESGRQPRKILLTTKVYSSFPADLQSSENSLLLSRAATVKEALQLAMLAARFPQLEIKTVGQANAIEDWEKIPQTFRRLAFRSIVMSRKPSAGLRLLDATGLLDKFLPEVTAGRHLTQNRFHAYDIFEHLLRSIDGAYDLNEPVRWAALLHDIGKVPTRVEAPTGEASFHNHEMYSARMAVPIMKRLAVPITIGQKVKFLVRNHMFHYTDEWSDKAVRRFVKKVPLEELQDLINLRLADRKGSGKKTAFPKALQKLMQHIDEIIEKEKEFKIRDLAIDGHQLMAMGVPASRTMGDILKYLHEEVKNGRLENTAEALAARVKTEYHAILSEVEDENKN